MTIQTRSKFYFINEVDDSNLNLPFDEGSGEINAQLNVGGYSVTQLAVEIARALNDAGSQPYTVSFDRENRTYTISSDATFTLLGASGATSGLSIFPTIGFDLIDKSGQLSYSSDSVAGNEYKPQFFLQRFTPFENFREKVDSKVNEAASGNLETVSFGERRFMEFELRFVTDIDQGPNGVIETNVNGVSNLRDFMEFITNKLPLEFMADRKDVSTFETILLERTPESPDGVNFKIKEQFQQGLAGYFRTGTLRFRKVV
jgi:hypothetical protein